MIGSSRMDLAFLMASLHGEDGGHFEGVLVGIDLVVGAVEDIDVEVDDRVAGDDAVESWPPSRP
jgi:hypothetical protein